MNDDPLAYWTPEENDTVTISIKEYTRLKETAIILNALYEAGVDNWEGYDYAMTIIAEEESEEE